MHFFGRSNQKNAAAITHENAVLLRASGIGSTCVHSQQRGYRASVSIARIDNRLLYTTDYYLPYEFYSRYIASLLN